MEQYRNCNRNSCGRYPAQPNLMPQYAKNRNSGCSCGNAGNGTPRSINNPSANNRMTNGNSICETTRRVTEACGMTGCASAVGIAYVPNQEFGEIYDARTGLREGTMFPALNLIFCGVRGK